MMTQKCFEHVECFEGGLVPCESSINIVSLPWLSRVLSLKFPRRKGGVAIVLPSYL